MSGSSTDSESLSCGEEEMASTMMSITDAIPESKNQREATGGEKKVADVQVPRLMEKSGGAKLGEDESGAKLTECTRSVSRTQEEKKQHQEQKVTVSKNNEEESGGEERGGLKSQVLTLREQMRILRKEQCRLLIEKDKQVDLNEKKGADGGRLAEAKAKLERAKSNREQLGLHYQRKEAAAAAEGVTLEVYKKLKDEYFGFVRQAGELDLQLKEMEEDLKSAHNSLGRMERELWAAEDKNGPRRKGANPWQVGVPYGCGRSGR